MGILLAKGGSRLAAAVESSRKIRYVATEPRPRRPHGEGGLAPPFGGHGSFESGSLSIPATAGEGEVLGSDRNSRTSIRRCSRLNGRYGSQTGAMSTSCLGVCAFCARVRLPLRQSKKKLKKRAQKSGEEIRPETWFRCAFVMVFTTVQGLCGLGSAEGTRTDQPDCESAWSVAHNRCFLSRFPGPLQIKAWRHPSARIEL